MAESGTGTSSFLPAPLQTIVKELTTNPGDVVTARIRLALMIALGAIVLVAIVFSMLAAFKYISSQGEEGKVTEAKKAVQSILVGIAVLFISIIGIFLVFTFFGVTAPDTGLCAPCVDSDLSNDNLCDDYVRTGDLEYCE
jgi:heme/copper-type cytochrome/quinol oxidase subunit 2